MDRTSRFIEATKQTLKIMEKNGDINSPTYKVYSGWANGWCGLCNIKLEVLEFRKTGSGAEHILKCGHSLTVISLEDEVSSLSEGSSYSRVGLQESGDLDIHVEHSGSDLNKEAQEISITKLFCHYIYPEFDFFINDKQDSPYDVIAEISRTHKKEFFQITKLNDKDFWKRLNLNRKVDAVLSDIEKLVSEAINRKINFDPNEKCKIILLIDARPGVIESIGKEIQLKLANLLQNSGFKEVWLTGATREITFRLI